MSVPGLRLTWFGGTVLCNAIETVQKYEIKKQDKDRKKDISSDVSNKIGQRKCLEICSKAACGKVEEFSRKVACAYTGSGTSIIPAELVRERGRN